MNASQEVYLSPHAFLLLYSALALPCPSEPALHLPALRAAAAAASLLAVSRPPESLLPLEMLSLAGPWLVPG